MLGDADALEGLRDRLRLFAARRLRNWAEAEDVAQEALRRALDTMRSGKLENPAALPAFLFQTVVHICQHRSLSAGREAKAMQRLATEGPALAAAEPGDPLQTLISEEQREAVRRALDRLEPGDRELLNLSYIETLDAADIGRRLGLSPGNVRVRRHRALRRLSEFLDVTRETDRGLNK
jgi:RNA polymerase sigma-70 factor (ECF subfamily)